MTNSRVRIILFAHAPYAKFLVTSLGSILAQSYASLEVVVLSDGSQEVKDVADRFASDSRCRFSCQGDQPFLQAANDRMREYQGEYIGTWNSDDIYNRDHVKLLVEALDEDSGLGAAFDNLEYFKESPPAAAMSKELQSSDLLISRRQAKRLGSRRLSVQDIFTDNLMTGPSTLIRRSILDQVGGYDQDIFLNCDLHWFYRLASYFPVRFVDYLGVRKRIHPLNNTAVNPHYEHGLRELEHIRSHYLDVYQRIGCRAFNKKLGRKYFRLGMYYGKRGETEQAREMYRQAMLLRRWSFRYHWEYYCSRIGSKARDDDPGPPR